MASGSRFNPASPGPSSADGDAPLAQESRKAVLASAADSGQRVYAVHFPFPGLGKFENRDGTFVWVAE